MKNLQKGNTKTDRGIRRLMRPLTHIIQPILPQVAYRKDKMCTYLVSSHSFKDLHVPISLLNLISHPSALT